MPSLIIDPFHGAAGDMIIGSLLAIIAEQEQEQVLQAMASVVAYPEVEPVQRCGISALKIHTRASPVHRTHSDVQAHIRTAHVPVEVIEQALRVFDRIARAEAQVHGYNRGSVAATREVEGEHHDLHTEQKHFHEVGADDAIADIIGSCMSLYLLHPARVIVLPVATGSGVVRIAHGVVPVPAPATAEILANSSLVTRFGGGEGELLTPTGAAILAEFATHTGIEPGAPVTGIVKRIGYGAGSREDPDSPNVLRTMMIEMNAETIDTHNGGTHDHEYND